MSDDSAWHKVIRELPDTCDEFIKKVNDHSIDIARIGRALGVAHECCICGDTIVDDDEFFDQMAEHYDVDVGELRTAIFLNVSCWADWDHPNMCSYHGYQESRDQ